MCITDRVRHRCQHLGRYLGFESCQWFDLDEEMMANGVSENEPLCVANDELCLMHSSFKYIDRDTLCVTCSGKRKEQVRGKEDDVEKKKGTENEKAGVDEEDDEKRDTILALYPHPHPLYDSKKRVTFFIGPSTANSSRAPSLAGSRPSSPVIEDKSEKPLPDNGLLYPISGPRFDYPIGDMTMKDMSRFERYFKIKPPNSYNWIFYSGKKGIRYEEFARFKNGADPTFNGKHFGDMYHNDVVRRHLMKYLCKGEKWKASAMSFYRFACIAKGHVHLLLPPDCKDPLHPYPDGVDGPVDSYWELFEMWALTSRGRVKKITRYNADDFSEVGTLWQIGQPVLGERPDFGISPRPFKRYEEIDRDLYSAALWT